MPGELLH
jgi:hypothetical protein